MEVSEVQYSKNTLKEKQVSIKVLDHKHKNFSCLRVANPTKKVLDQKKNI